MRTITVQGHDRKGWATERIDVADPEVSTKVIDHLVYLRDRGEGPVSLWFQWEDHDVSIEFHIERPAIDSIIRIFERDPPVAAYEKLTKGADE